MADHRIDPHAGGPVATAGAPLADASAIVILVHGRGASADGMLDLGRHFWRDDVAYLAPQAAGATWYPHSLHPGRPCAPLGRGPCRSRRAGG